MGKKEACGLHRKQKKESIRLWYNTVTGAVWYNTVLSVELELSYIENVLDTESGFSSRLGGG